MEHWVVSAIICVSVVVLVFWLCVSDYDEPDEAGEETDHE